MRISLSNGLLGNIKPREVMCLKCRRVEVTDAPSPICDVGFCYGEKMVTVVKSSIDGTRITGTDELGPTGR
jgi:hypothetical protein